MRGRLRMRSACEIWPFASRLCNVGFVSGADDQQGAEDDAEPKPAVCPSDSIRFRCLREDKAVTDYEESDGQRIH